MTSVTSDGDGPVEGSRDRNEVHLRGKVTSGPERRTLPSGDELVTLGVTVVRDGGGVDTIRVSVGPAPAAGRRPGPGQVGRRALAAAEAVGRGQRVVIDGALRRRWWDGGGTRRSLVEVHASAVTADRSGPDASP